MPKSYEFPVKDVSQTLITMLALITRHRLQTFSRIETENIRFQNDKVEIKIPAELKPSALTRSDECSLFPGIKKKKRFASPQLSKFTSRKPDPYGGALKTCSYHSTPPPPSPIEPGSSQTLSRRVRGVLEKCKINTSILSGYSTRHASTSAAKRKGLDITIIKKTAGWTESSKTSAKFYNLPLTQERD